jgi:acylphosphatase
MASSDPVGGERREVHYEGRVQGVGFRYSTRSIASRYRVTGYVRNLRDGRVQLVAEGVSDELDRFLDDIDEAMSGYIRAADVVRLPPSGEFVDFNIA